MADILKQFTSNTIFFTIIYYSMTNLLQVLQENINQEGYMISTANRVQCDKTEDVQLMAIETQLLKMLQ